MRTRAAALALLIVLIGGGCGGRGSKAAPKPVTVFAAASLSEAFRAMQKPFTAEHDAYSLRFSFAGSQQLAAQVQQDAPADVIATADRSSMARAEPKTLHKAPTLFARNRLVIAVRPGNPLGIKTLADLGRPGVKAVLAAPAVPAGNYARQALSKASATVHPVSLEDNVEGVVTKVALGEADAGIVYETDARLAGRGVEPVKIPNTENVLAEYFVMLIPSAKQKAGGEAFRSFLLSSSGRKVLERYGFVVA
jgi:molybdate transport system substrate-binding protein